MPEATQNTTIMQSLNAISKLAALEDLQRCAAGLVESIVSRKESCDRLRQALASAGQAAWAADLFYDARVLGQLEMRLENMRGSIERVRAALEPGAPRVAESSGPQPAPASGR